MFATFETKLVDMKCLSEQSNGFKSENIVEKLWISNTSYTSAIACQRLQILHYTIFALPMFLSILKPQKSRFKNFSQYGYLSAFYKRSNFNWLTLVFVVGEL